jgi:hypothetical protein
VSSLDERFAAVDRQLTEKLRDARRSTRHRGVRGDELAGVLGKEIRDHFIECASIHERCEVRDAHDARSQEVDLVLLNRFHPAFALADRPRFICIEGVIAAAEVKTSLTKREIIDCLIKARAFKRLLASVGESDLKAHNITEAEDTFRYLFRRPFFAFAYEGTSNLRTVQDNIEEWVKDNHVCDIERIDAVFVLGKGVIVNLGAGAGAIQMRDINGDLLSGFVRSETLSIFSQLISWLSVVGPSFTSLEPILLKYAPFNTKGYLK